MTSFNWNTPIPSTPDPTFILVENISLSATETTVRDFFAFCGQIETIELHKTEQGTQIALVKFNDLESAKTALLLTDALINHEAISVRPLFPETEPSTPPQGADPAQREASAPEGSNNNNKRENGKPALYVVHELLAAGYLLGEHVINSASEFDAKYRVTNRTQEQARTLDRQYKVTDYLNQWDSKFGISKKAMDAYNKFQNNPTGQRVIFTVKEAYDSAIQLRNDARDIAERKRVQGEKIFGTIPLPPTPQAPSTSTNPNAPPPPQQQQQQQQQPGPMQPGPMQYEKQQ